MKLFRYILTVLAILSLIGCFGFSAVAAMPEGIWDGESKLRNNRNYILNEKKIIKEDVIIPKDTVLIVDEFGQLVVPNGLTLIVEGGINVHRGGNILFSGNIEVKETGSISASGNIMGEEESDLQVAGGVSIKPEGYFHTLSNTNISDNGLLVIEGRSIIKKEAALTNNGKIYVQNGGELVNGGNIRVEEKGVFESLGHVTLKRKGVIVSCGSTSFKENSSFTLLGKAYADQNGTFSDLSKHIDLSVFTADILKYEEEVTKRGIDISWAQGEVDWEKLSKSGIDFVYIRAGRGDVDGTGPKEDTFFRRNIEQANQYGIDAGVYFYSYAETVDQAEDEAEFFVTLLDGYRITYPVALDIEEETRRKDQSRIAEAFLETVAEEGYYPMIYSYRNRLDTHFSDDILEKYAVWVARLKYKPETRYDYYIWQYSHSGEIAGIEGNVDFNISYRDFPDILKDYGLNHLNL